MTNEERRELMAQRQAICLRINKESVMQLRDLATRSGVKQYKILEMGIELAAKKLAVVS